MDKYHYTAVDQNGIPRVGVVQADSERLAAQTLHNKGLIVTGIKAVETSPISKTIANIRGVPRRELVVFTREFATMIDSGLPITQALRILQQQAKSTTFRDALLSILQDVDGGESLHAALGRHPKIFNRLYLSLIRAGEASGKLGEIMSRLADMLEADNEFKSKVRGAMIYPVIIVLVMIAVLVVMFLFVIPKLSDLYAQLDVELPFMTRILINVSNALVHYWWISVVLIPLAIVGLKSLLRIDEVRIKVDRFKLRAPVLGKLSRDVQLTSFTRVLGILVKAGLPLLDALDIAKETVGNSIYKKGVENAVKAVEKGKPLADGFRSDIAFPVILPEMVGVGEQTGKLDEVLAKISSYFEAEATHQSENLATAIEPIVLVVLGVMVGFMVISLILPIYSLTSKF